MLCRWQALKIFYFPGVEAAGKPERIDQLQQP